MPVVIFVVLLLPLENPVSAADPASVEWFEKKIRPVLIQHCYECHSSSAKEIAGGLRLDFRDVVLKGGETGPAVVPGKPERSLLIKALRYDSLEMPPAAKLPEHVIADFERWIQIGVPDPRAAPSTAARDEEPTRSGAKPLWSIQPLAESSPPQTTSKWPDSLIDHFIAKQHEQNSLVPVVDAPPRVLMRRLYYDLIGLPPTFEELSEFEQNFSLARYSELIDELLASPRFGERWGRHWLDIARYAESNGNDRNVIFPHAWRYRDYVIRSFNQDKPFDQFVREQIAGDLIPSDNWQQRDEQLIATGYLTLGSKVLGEGDADLFKMNLIDEQIDVVTRSILGLTVSCARCHDHKFDPVPTRDYYALAGIFGSTESLYGPMTNGNKYGFDRSLQPIGENGVALDGPAKQHREDVAEATAVRNKARSSRYGFVRKKAALENEKKKNPGETRASEIDAEMKELEAEIADWDKKIEDLDAALKKLTDNPPEFPDYCMAVRDVTEPVDSAIRIRGEVKQKGDVVPRGLPALFGAIDSSSITEKQSGRLFLAQWLTREASPLAARVAVNRVWYHLFGAGLVETVDNFGNTGERPSHPELLDWLAAQFQKNGWSIKQLIREIALSRTYRLASEADDHNAAVDPANRLLWRASIRRLDAETLRDSMLQVSGELGVTPPEGSVISTFEEREFNSKTFPSHEQLQSKHRSVYLPIARYWVPEVLREFDFADPSLVIGKRDQRTMPSQHLFLMNSEFVIDRAKVIAGKLEAVEGDDTKRVALVFQTILRRQPSQADVEGMTRLVNSLKTSSESASRITDEPSIGWAAACQALLMSAEFQYVP